MGTPGGLSQQGTTSRLQKAAQVHIKLEHPHLQPDGCADGGTHTSQKGSICARAFNPRFL